MNKQLEFLIECNKDIEKGHFLWNNWRVNEKVNIINLENADLSNITLSKYNFHGANLKGANFSNSILLDCDFMGANLEETKFVNAKCSFSNFTKSKLSNSNLENSEFTMVIFISINCEGSNFTNSTITNTFLNGSDLRKVNFYGSKIIMSNLIKCNLEEAKFENCFLSGSNLTSSNLNESIIKNSTIFGTSVWNITTKGSFQENLTITNGYDDAVITIDNIEIASFIYLVIDNTKVTSAIDTITNKMVLILGRFTPERKDVLEYLKMNLRKKDLVPILFDFDKPKHRDLTETVGLIGRMSKLIIADLTDAKSIPQELSELIPNNPSISVQPILLKNNHAYSMFEHWKMYPWVKNTFEYENKTDLNNLII